MSTLDKQNLHIPLSQGMDNRAGEFALEAPKLEVLENATFDDSGELKKRLGTQTKTNSVIQLLAAPNITNTNNVAIAANGDQLLLFSDGNTYTWSESEGKWRRAWFHESCIVDETPIVGDVEKIDDRAVDSCTIDGITAVATLDTISFYDDATGSLIGSRDISSKNAIRVKLRPVSTNRILAFYHNNGTGNIDALSFDTEDIEGTINGAVASTHPVANGYAWDVDSRAGFGNAYLAAEVTAASNEYDVVIYDPDGTKNATAPKTGKNCQDHIAISVHSGEAKIGVVRYDHVAGRVEVDLLDGGGLDVATRVGLIGPSGTPNALTCVYVDDADDSFYIYMERTHSTTAVSNPASGTAGGAQEIQWAEYNETDGLVNVYDFLKNSRIFSRACETADNKPRLLIKHVPRLMTNTTVTGDGRVVLGGLDVAFSGSAYTNAGSGTVLQTGFVLMDGEYPIGDAFPPQPLARVLFGEAFHSGSVLGGGSDLRNLQPLGGSVCQSVLPTEGRGDRRIKFDFADARGYKAIEVGKSTYIPGGFLAHYDGENVREAAPWLFPENITHDGNGSSSPWGTSLTPGDFFVYAFYWVQRNSSGEVVRSTNAGSGLVYYTSDNRRFYIPTIPYTRYGKDEERIYLEVYRSQMNTTAGLDAPRYLASKSPLFSGSGIGGTATVGSDNVIFNDPSVEYVTWEETSSGYGDSRIVQAPPDPFQAGVLDQVPAGPCKALASGQNRIFYLGPEDDNTVYYSKLRSTGELASFNEALTITIPGESGGVRAIYPWEDKVVVFTERGVYVVPGVGPDNFGRGDYGLPRLVDNVSGCIDERAIAPVPGGIIYKGDRGWHYMNRGEQVQYIGADVEDFDSSTTTACVVVPDQHRVIAYAGGTNTLVFDWLSNQWSNWPEIDAKSAVIWQDAPRWIDDSTGAVTEHSADYLSGGTTGYGMVLQTAWIKVDQGLNGWGRNYWWELLGRLSNLDNTANIRVRVAYNYDDTWRDDVTFDIATADEDPMRIRYRFKGSYAKCAAVKFRIEDVDPGDDDWTCGLTLSGLSLQVGIKQGLTRSPAPSSPGVGAE